jgi:hypothetical protein
LPSQNISPISRNNSKPKKAAQATDAASPKIMPASMRVCIPSTPIS